MPDPRELRIKIVIDDAEAKSKLGSVDSGLKQIESTAKSTGTAVATYEKTVDDLVKSKQAATTAVDIFNKRTIDTKTALDQTRQAIQLNSREVQDLFTWVNRGGTGWRDYAAMAREAWTILKSIRFSDIRDGVQGLGEALGVTVANLGLLGTVGVIAGTAMASWELGKRIGEWTGLTGAIQHATEWLLNWNDAQQTDGAKQDSINLAIQRGADAHISYGDAVKYNAQWTKNAMEGAKAFNDVLARQNAPAESAKQIAAWTTELKNVEAAGVLKQLKADIESHNFSLKELADRYRVSTDAIGYLKRGMDDEAAGHKKAEDATRKHREEIEKWNKAVDDATVHMNLSTFTLNRYGAVTLPNVTTALSNTIPVITGVTDELSVMDGGFGLLESRITTISTTSLPGLQPQLQKTTNMLQEMRQKALDLWAGMSKGEGIAGFFNNLGDSIVKGFGSLISGGITMAIQKGIDLAWTGLKKLGSAIGGLFGIKSGPSDAEKQGRVLEKDFEDSLGGFEQMMTKISQAAVATGRSLDWVRTKVKELLDAERQGPDAVRKVIDEINQAFDEQAADQQRAKELIDEYHLSIEQLGPAWRNQQLDEQVKGLMNDFRIMVDVLGINAPDALNLMSGKFNDLIHTAQKTGYEIPSNLKPILRQMIDLGLLTDEQGNKYASLEDTGVSFAETFSQSVDRLIKKFDELIDKLYGAKKGVDDIPSNKDITITQHLVGDYVRDFGPDIPFVPNPAPLPQEAMPGVFHRGGPIDDAVRGPARLLDFLPRAHSGLAIDERLIVAQTGEGVLNRGAMRSIGGAAGLNALNRGGRFGGDTNIAFSVDRITIGANLTEDQAVSGFGRAAVRELSRRGVRFRRAA